MTKAEQAALNAYPREDDAWCGSNVDRRIGYKQGYGQAQQDIMEKFKMWVAYNGYTAEDAEAVYNDFKQFIGEN